MRSSANPFVPLRSTSSVLSGVGLNAKPAAATYVRPVDALAAVAVAASEVSDLSELLGRLAQLTLGPTGADRASFFLSDDDSALELWAVALLTDTGPEGFAEGLAMGPIHLDDVQAEQLHGGAIAVEDASTSPLVPPDWLEAFELASLVVAPLRCGADVLGVLVVDFAERRPLSAELVALVDAIARSSAVAVAHARACARLAERAGALQKLLHATRDLSSAASLRETAELVASAIEDVLGATHLSVHLLDRTGTRYRLLLQRGMQLPVEGEVARLPRKIVERVGGPWREAPVPSPVVLTDVARLTGLSVDVLGDVTTAIVLPLVGRDGRVFGIVAAGLADSRGPTPAQLELAEALAAHIAFAVERARLLERVAVGAQFANAVLELNDLDDEAPDGLLAGLRDAVPSTVGFRIVGIRLATEQGIVEVGDLLGTSAERHLWRSWRRRRTRPDVLSLDGALYAPIWDSGCVIGAVRAVSEAGPLAQHECELLLSLAAAIGDAAKRQALRRQIERRDRELAVARERASVAWDLHQTVAGFLRAIERTAEKLVLASDGEARADAELVSALTRSGRRELEDAVRMAAPLAFDARGLAETVDGAVMGLGELLGADADVSVRGVSRRLPIEVQQLLLRVVFETIHRVERTGRAAGIAVRLEFGEGEVAVAVRDDGVDLGTREGAEPTPSAHFGLRMVQRRVEEAGGRFTLEHRPPRGLLLRATVPA